VRRLEVHTRLTSHGRCVPSYHWCDRQRLAGLGRGIVANLLLWPFRLPSGVFSMLPPGGSQVFNPPSFERWMICPNQPLDCEQ